MGSDVSTAAPAPGSLPAIVRACRPQHWIKNLLVLAAPAAAGLEVSLDLVGRILLAFAAMSLAASGTYLLNDVRDREVDRRHPTKRHRPVASGEVSVGTATALGVTLLVVATALPIAVGVASLAVVVGAYVAATSSYSLGLKHVPIVELAIVASGFVLRAVAGAVSVDVPVSRWFLIVVSAGALYLVATKRWAERRDVDEGDQRQVLSAYPDDTLREIRFTTAAVTLMAYVLWAFESATDSAGAVWHELSIIPVALAMFRYGAAVHEGAGEAPEEVFLRDRLIQVLGAVWLVLWLAGIHGGRT